MPVLYVINSPISDHLPVYVEFKLKLPKPPPCYNSTRCYKRYDPDLFTADLATKSDQFLSIFLRGRHKSQTRNV